MKTFWNQTYVDCKKDDIFSWFFIRYYFHLKKDKFWESCAKLRIQLFDTLYGTLVKTSWQLTPGVSEQFCYDQKVPYRQVRLYYSFYDNAPFFRIQTFASRNEQNLLFMWNSARSCDNTFQIIDFFQSQIHIQLKSKICISIW